MAILRFAFYGVLVYLYYLVAYPYWTSAAWGFSCFPAILIASGGLYLLFKLMNWSPGLAKVAMEGLFIAGVAVYLGYSMPTKPGESSPVKQWISGRRPTQADAELGLKRLGINPESEPGQWVVGLFPYR